MKFVSKMGAGEEKPKVEKRSDYMLDVTGPPAPNTAFLPNEGLVVGMIDKPSRSAILKPAAEARSTLYETEGGGEGDELEPGEVKRRKTLLGN